MLVAVLVAFPAAILCAVLAVLNWGRPDHPNVIALATGAAVNLLISVGVFVWVIRSVNRTNP